MDEHKITQIFKDTAFVRTGGSPEELKAAEYIRDHLAKQGLEAEIEPFDVPMADISRAEFLVGGQSIPCKGYLCAGSGQVEAPLYYLRNNDPHSLSQCRGKIVLMDTGVGYWRYQDLLDNGAVGFVTFNGDMRSPDRDIDQKELRAYVHNGRRIPGVNLHVRDAVELVRGGGTAARITLEQNEYTGQSRNVVLDLPGQQEGYIAFTAHYDSTSLSQGVYDNMSGSVGLLALAEHFAANPHRYGLRFIWCGSEERGLLGSKAYCAQEERLKDCVLDINLDMIGCLMGKFTYCVTGEEKLCHYIDYLASELGFGIEGKQGAYPSDSTPFADKGVPAVTFARQAPRNTATIHDRYDTLEVMSAQQMVRDIDFLIAFAGRMANAARCPVAREIPETVKEQLDVYLNRKRGERK